jgi:diguanylate cyclase (GGDEF)-like protein
MLFSADRPVRDLLESFAMLLAAANGAAVVAIALIEDEQVRFEYVLRGGVSALPLERRVPDESAVARAVSGGEAIVEATLAHSSAVVPIPSGGRTIGALGLEWSRTAAVDDYDVGLLEACVVHLGARIQDDYQRTERERLQQIASTDALTGLANRRMFDEGLAREWTRCARSQTPLSLLLLDVDFFKVYNDTYGHIAGDGCLRRIAGAIASCVKRPGDLVCRYGGEEFVVVLPETSAADAILVGEAICEAVRQVHIPHHGSSLGYTTVSIGCASALPRAGGEPQQLSEAADAQLYRAKENGRNRVASPDSLSESEIVERQVAPQHNLPAPRTQFFGRDGDLDVMSALLQECRLLTIAGPGGVGKTRLAVEFGRRHAARYADGVCFVDLATVNEGSFVVPTVLAAMGLREEPGRDADETLLHHLGVKQALLILDNCEQIVDRAAALVDRLLQACPNLCLIVTSRHTLDVTNEQVYRVATLAETDSVALFSSRARSVFPSFSLTPQNLAAVKRICAQLDGIPLALELAAARVRMLSVDELDSQLRDRFRILTGGSRTAQQRQRTLYDTIEWSYNLLDETERLVTRRLAVFAGSFSLDSATAICVTADRPIEMMDLLARLIDKSLVQFDPVVGRYWLLESTKEFGVKCLTEADEFEPLRARYAARLSTLASDAEKRFGKGAGDVARHEVVSNYADFRAAMEWALADEQDVALGAELVASLGWYWTERGLWREGRFWLQLALRRDPSEVGLNPTARLRLASAVAYYVQAEFAAMHAEARRSEEAYAALGDATGVASARNLMAIAAQHAGRPQEAYDLWQSVLQTSRDVGNVRMEAVVLGNLAELLTDWKSDFAESERLYERATEIHRELANSFPLGVTLGDWSATAAYQGDFRRAERLAREALETFRGIEEEMRSIEALIRIGHYRVWAGRYDEAKKPLRDAIEPLRGCNNPLYLVRAAEAFAELALGLGHSQQASKLLSFGERGRESKNLARPAPLQAHFDGARDACRSALGDEAFARSWQQGRSLGDAEALDLARSLVTA